MGVVQHTARRMVVSSTVLAFLSIGISVKAQMLDRNCFGSENGTLSDTFLASPVDEEAQAVVYGGERAFSVNLVKGLGFEDLTKSEVLKTYMFDRAYQAVRERTPGLGYVFKHANKLYFEKDLKLNECLRLALADQIE